MPQPPHTYLHGVHTAKNAVAAKDAKATVAVAQAKARLALVERMRQLAIDDRRLAELKAHIDAALRSKPAKADAVLIKSIQLLEKLAKEHDKLTQASTALSVPAKNVIRALPHLKGPGPNYAAALQTVLVFVLVLRQFLATKPRPGPE